MRLTAMTYNLMRVCEEISKTQNPELIHPSDKKYAQALEKRITRISSYTIRAVQTQSSQECLWSILCVHSLLD